MKKDTHTEIKENVKFLKYWLLMTKNLFLTLLTASGLRFYQEGALA